MQHLLLAEVTTTCPIIGDTSTGVHLGKVELRLLVLLLQCQDYVHYAGLSYSIVAKVADADTAVSRSGKWGKDQCQ